MSSGVLIDLGSMQRLSLSEQEPFKVIGEIERLRASQMRAYRIRNISEEGLARPQHKKDDGN
jgi:hypothetical protein